MCEKTYPFSSNQPDSHPVFFLGPITRRQVDLDGAPGEMEAAACCRSGRLGGHLAAQASQGWAWDPLPYHLASCALVKWPRVSFFLARIKSFPRKTRPESIAVCVCVCVLDTAGRGQAPRLICMLLHSWLVLSGECHGNTVLFKHRSWCCHRKAALGN